MNPANETRISFRQVLDRQMRDRYPANFTKASDTAPVNVYNMKNSCLCPKPVIQTNPPSNDVLKSAFHDIKCLNGSCDKCGIEKTFNWALKEGCNPQVRYCNIIVHEGVAQGMKI